MLAVSTHARFVLVQCSLYRHLIESIVKVKPTFKEFEPHCAIDKCAKDGVKEFLHFTLHLLSYIIWLGILFSIFLSPDFESKQTPNRADSEYTSDGESSEPHSPQSSDSERNATSEDYEDISDTSRPRLLHSFDFTRRAEDATTLKVKRLRANDRERRRVNLINSAMETLRKVIPELRERRKITKLELLRCANRYIWLLQQSLLTGRPIDEIQEALAYYQYTGPISNPNFFQYDQGFAYAFQSFQWMLLLE